MRRMRKSPFQIYTPPELTCNVNLQVTLGLSFPLKLGCRPLLPLSIPSPQLPLPH